jgi:hypothetical protein
MTDFKKRLSSWRQEAGFAQPTQDHPWTTGMVEAHHRQQLLRSALLCLESLQQYDAFSAEILAYVNKGNRTEEQQQRVTDFAAAILQAYEVTSGRALQLAINNVLEDLPREVIQTVYKELPAPPQQSLLRRLFGA